MATVVASFTGTNYDHSEDTLNLPDPHDMEQFNISPEETDPKTEGTETPFVLHFEKDVIRFHQSRDLSRHLDRQGIVSTIRNSEMPRELFDITLDCLVTRKTPGRLDDAIDILAQLGVRLLQLIVDSKILWKPGIDEDYWYVVIRAIGKSGLPPAFKLIEKLRWRSDEAYVEALSDLGGDQAKKALQRVVREETGFIQELAQENLAEWTE